MAEAHRTLLLLVAAMSCLVTVSQAHQKIHIVGGSYGWKIPPNKTFYEEWANKQSFFVGDKLGSYQYTLLIRRYSHYIERHTKTSISYLV